MDDSLYFTETHYAVREMVRSFARESVAPVAAQHDADSTFPWENIKAMGELGLLGVPWPEEIGGAGFDTLSFMIAIEELGRVDASHALTISAHTTLGTSPIVNFGTPDQIARYVRPLASGRVLGGFGLTEDTAGSDAGGTKTTAVRQGDHYVLNGKWQWGSGSANCHWLSGGAVVMENGAPRRLPSGAPETRSMFFPASSVKLIDSWDTAGLCGTGSGEFEATGLRVPKAHTIALATDPPVAQGALYTFPVFGLLALGIAAVMLGNARAAVDDLVQLASVRKPQGSARILAERATAQAALAEATAQLRAARAYYYDSVSRAWDKATATGAVALDERVDLRLAATHAVRVCASVTRSMCDLGGGASIFLASPLQRRFRDAFVGAQHMMIAPQTYELTGRALMGLPTTRPSSNRGRSFRLQSLARLLVLRSSALRSRQILKGQRDPAPVELPENWVLTLPPILMHESVEGT